MVDLKVLMHKTIGVLFNNTPQNNFLSDIATIEGVLVGITIPISLQVVIWAAERYRDQEIARFFIKENLYRAQFFLFFLNIIIAIYLRFQNNTNLIVLWIMFIWMIVNLYIFFKFIKLVESYATETDRIILKKLNEIVETILKK